MDYKNLGRTGLKISAVGLGCGNFGGVGSAPEFFGKGESDEEAFALMDIALELAQAGGLVLPLFGQVDQLVKLLTPEQVAGLLHGESTTYLGNEVTPKPLSNELD